MTVGRARYSGTAVHKVQQVYGHFVFTQRIGLLYVSFQLLNLHRNCRPSVTILR